MVHRCECCKYTTDKRFNYEKHLSSERHRLIEKSQQNQLPTTQKQHIDNPKTTIELEKVATEFTCKYCDQQFRFRQSMNRHIKYTCTKNKDEDLKELVRLMNIQMEQQKNEFISQLQTQKQEFSKKIDSQSKQIDKLMGKLEIHGSFNTTNNIQNINLLAYRATDVSHLTDDDYRRCIKKVNHCVRNMIEKVHFNPSKPENMNIYISNIKDKYIMVYDGLNWNLANKKDEIDRLYEEKEMMLEEWLESNPEKELKEKFMKYLNNKESDECLNRIKEEIKLMLYNNQKMIELKNL
jgi:uncharacterized Zn-finger protein